MCYIKLNQVNYFFFILFGCMLILGCMLFFKCSHKKEIEVCTDIGFVQQQFPKIEDIEEVRYYYNVRSNEREIGLQDIEFCGFIKIGEDFYEKIVRDYKWKETKKSKKVIPKKYLWSMIMRNIIFCIIMTFPMMENIKLIHGEEIFIWMKRIEYFILNVTGKCMMEI